MLISLHKTNNGFSLVELLITISILGIISTVTLPAYTSYMTKTRRMEAKVSLNKLALAIEKYQIEHGHYDGMVIADDTQTRFYRFSIKMMPASYVLQATPLGVQADNDSDCGELILNSKGEYTHLGAVENVEC